MKPTIYGRLEHGEWQEYPTQVGRIIDAFEGVYKFIIQCEAE